MLMMVLIFINMVLVLIMMIIFKMMLVFVGLADGSIGGVRPILKTVLAMLVFIAMFLHQN
jgi:hypothetical protein